MFARTSAGFVAILSCACADVAKGPKEEIPFPDVPPAEPAMKRLTAAQWKNSVTDVFGEGIALPAALEPDSPAAGLIAVGASRATVSGWGVEQYEAAAYSIAAQIMDDEARRSAVVPCAPAGTTDDACARAYLEQVGLRLWRRPLIQEEVDGLAGLAATAATTLGDFYDGLEFATAAMLQSPNFLFRVEIGEGGRYDDFEMATRLGYFLWNTTPDDALLAAAEAGRLTTDEGLAEQVDRMLASERARDGVRRFFTDMFELYRLDELSKDPTIFTHYSTELGRYAREETLLGIERIVFDLDTDYREILTTDQTYVNRHLAAIYSVPAGARDGFGLVTLPEATQRPGLLGQVSFLALRSHPRATSAVLRGHFVRKVLLCHTIPPPPVNANTGLPEPSETARTLRERNVIHLEKPECAGCHSLMDPIGLGFENFDGVGRWRDMDNGAPIDASGDVDGVPFRNPVELAQAVHDHPDITRCLVKSLYQYAVGHEATRDEDPLVDVLDQRFEQSGYRVRSLLHDVATSPGFSNAKEVTP